MTEENELAALQASLRGALATAEALAALAPGIEAMKSSSELGSDDLASLARVSAAHAIASAALRGLVNRLVERKQREET
ncbi:MAG TPA: hypothetical protein VD833_08515 [Vicinamibacterales bacterium]|nr:hypothetical protein [Vicinamibacterales bacterium]